MANEETQPTFGTALLVVLGSGLIGAALSPFFMGVGFLGGGLPVLILAGALVRALAIRMIVRAMGFQIAYVGAFIAAMAGTVLGMALRIVFPGALTGGPVFIPFISLAGLPGLLLTAWLVQTNATRAPRELPL
jgi:hypothetical protein